MVDNGDVNNCDIDNGDAQRPWFELCSPTVPSDKTDDWLNPIVPPKRNKQHSLLDFTTVSVILCPAEKEDGIVKMQHRAVKFNLDGATSYQSFAQG